jgi:hypothetical protein
MSIREAGAPRVRNRATSALAFLTSSLAGVDGPAGGRQRRAARPGPKCLQLRARTLEIETDGLHLGLVRRPQESRQLGVRCVDRLLRGLDLRLQRARRELKQRREVGLRRVELQLCDVDLAWIAGGLRVVELPLCHGHRLPGRGDLLR